MGSLYECLCEARLDRFYRTLCANGYTDCKSLLNMTSQDCSLLGIKGTTDRQRLFDLIHIIRSVQDSDAYDSDEELDHAGVSNRKRNHISYLNSNQSSNPSASKLPTPRRVQPTVIMKTVFPSRDPGIDAGLNTPESTSDDEPATKHSNTSTHSPRKKCDIEYIHHGVGYNYGLPRKRVQSSSNHNADTGEPRIKVCIRKRPLMKREVRSGESDVVAVPCHSTIQIKETKAAVDLTPYTLTHEFMFDEVFGENVTNEGMYEKTAKPLIEKIFHGGKATCFAFGQTGAGKTHTMLGDKSHSGLYLLAATDIFERIRSNAQYVEVQVWVSFFEIYCGQLFDLLNKRHRLHAREDGSHRVCIAGLTETSVCDVRSIMKVLDYGNNVRRKGSTGVNMDSSRSHAVLQLELRDTRNDQLGRISFIDLAGSERASEVTDTDKQTRMEGAEINQSLLALKECIRAIDQDTKHTPFRQSKLTHILKESFIGDSVTCMIANISPVQSACENTLNTLRYAHRVKEMKREPLGETRASRQSSTTRTLATSSSIFNPSSVLHSSTPVRPQSSRPYHSQPAVPTDTPISGHIPGVARSKRKTPVRHTPSVSSDTRPLSSPSSSDKSDSCNLNVMCELKVKALPACSIQRVFTKVQRASEEERANDTDLDAERHGELNDLNSSPVKAAGLLVNDVRETSTGGKTCDELDDGGNCEGANIESKLLSCDAKCSGGNKKSNAGDLIELDDDMELGSHADHVDGGTLRDQLLNAADVLMEGDSKTKSDVLTCGGRSDDNSLRHVRLSSDYDSDLMFGSAKVVPRQQMSSQSTDCLVTPLFNKTLLPGHSSDLAGAGKSVLHQTPARPFSATNSRGSDARNHLRKSSYDAARPLSRRNVQSSEKFLENLSHFTAGKPSQGYVTASCGEGELLGVPSGPESIESNLESDLAQYCYERRTTYDAPKASHDRNAASDLNTTRKFEANASDARRKTPVTTIHTEKLANSSSECLYNFSPLHTSKDTSAFKVTPGSSPSVIDKDIVHASGTSAVVCSTSSLMASVSNQLRASHDYRRALTSPLPRGHDEARLHLVTAHEEQLAKTTSLCKQEMKLLLGIKADATYQTFEEYLSRVDCALRLKMNQVQLMRDLILSYRQTATPHPAAHNT